MLIVGFCMEELDPYERTLIASLFIAMPREMDIAAPLFFQLLKQLRLRCTPSHPAWVAEAANASHLYG